MHPTPRPDSTDRSRHRRSCRQVFFGTFLPCVCWGWLLVSAGCERPADATRATGAGGSTTTTAADTETEPVTAAANASPIRLEPPALDFGPIQKGSTAEATVRLINTSDRPVRIVRAKTSCGCTVAEVPNGPIGPGESAAVAIRMTVNGQTGSRLAKTVRFILEDPLEPVRLSLTAEVREYVVITPQQLKRHIDDPQTVKLQAADDQPFRVLSVEPPVVEQSLHRRARRRHELTIEPSLWELYGRPNVITFKLDHPKTENVRLVIRARGSAQSNNASPLSRPSSFGRRQVSRAQDRPRPVLQVRPRRMHFGQLSPGQAVTREILLRDVEAIEKVAPVVTCASPLVEVDLIEWRGTQDGLLLRLNVESIGTELGSIRSTVTITYGLGRGSIAIYGTTQLGSSERDLLQESISLRSSNTSTWGE